MPKLIDMTGETFGKLTAVAYNSLNKKWICRCECGNTKEVSRIHLLDGHVKSCGCYSSEVTAKRNYRHGLAGTRLYKIYYGILQRCCVESNPAYERYGDRGITICDEWKSDFLVFYHWAMEHGYEEYLSIDRIDNDKGYCPENCRWVSQKVQCNNRSGNIKIETKTLKQLCEENGVKYTTVYARVRRGQDPVSAIKAVTGQSDIEPGV